MKMFGFILILFSSALHAQTTTYICNYSIYSNKSGNYKAKEKFELRFIVDKDKAYMTANNGSAEVIVFQSSDRIAFVEITATQNIMTTTIDTGLGSVHSRHTVLAGKLIPSQYYGECDIK